MANWYVSSVAYTAVAQFAINHAYAVGDIIRQLAAPSVGSERCFRCTTLGTSAGTEAAWTLTKAATTAQGTATFTEVTGNETWMGTSWANPFARLQIPGGSWPVSGDTIFISSDHAETQATSIAMTLIGTKTAPSKYICVTRPSSAIPPAQVDLATTAKITTTGASDLSIDAGSTGFYMYGITFNCGTGAGNQILTTQGLSSAAVFEQCAFNIVATGASSTVQIGNLGNLAASGDFAIWKNCNVAFTGATSNVVPCVPWLWDGGTYANTATQTGGAFTNSNATTGPSQGYEIRNVDLSTATGASGYYVGIGQMSRPRVGFVFTKCKIPATTLGIVSSARSAYADLPVDFIDCDNSTVLVHENHDRMGGTWTSDTANYLTAGATDGTTHKSWKAVTNANVDGILRTFELGDIFIWLTAAAHTLTIYCANTSSVTLKDNEFGFEVEYMASAASPLGTLANTFTQAWTAGANLATTAVAWTGLSSPTRQLVSKAITPAQAGWVRVRPIIRKASLTLWVDPLVAVS